LEPLSIMALISDLFLTFVAASLLLTTEPLPDDVTPQQAIDIAIDRRITEAGIVAAPIVDDARFLRRVTLDLAGRVPTRSELTEFLADADGDTRSALVDRLVASPDFAYHQRNELDLLLLARLRDDGEWRDYLLVATRENRSWDRLFREIILPERERPGEKGPAAFLRERVQELDDVTNDAAALLFGVNVSCAKCHDHPLVDDWLQDHYFGMASFFKRTYRTRKGMLAEKFEGDLKFTTVDGEEKPAAFMFLTGTTVADPSGPRSDDERKQLEEAIEKAQKEEDAADPPLPEFSPRSELVRMALEGNEQSFLARNMVNRVWARLMGRGLVHPLDQMHSENPPSHPELLDWLAHDFVAHGYDLKHLVRGIVLSDTYARDSVWTSADEPPAPELFARAVARPLTPRQFGLALSVATANPEQLPGLDKPDDWSGRRENFESQANGFARLVEIPEDSFQVSVDEALLFSNGEQIMNDYLRDGDDRLVGALATVDDVDELVTTAFECTLTRAPDDEERAAFKGYVNERSDRRATAVQQLVWALVTSPEFRFNH
jgi:hypothetical protein